MLVICAFFTLHTDIVSRIFSLRLNGSMLIVDIYGSITDSFLIHPVDIEVRFCIEITYQTCVVFFFHQFQEYGNHSIQILN